MCLALTKWTGIAHLTTTRFGTSKSLPLDNRRLSRKYKMMMDLPSVKASAWGTSRLPEHNIKQYAFQA
jgi:hypothetical protein